MHNITQKYFTEAQRCTDKNTMHKQNAQKKQGEHRIC